MTQLQGLNVQEMKEAILVLAKVADGKMARYSGGPEHDITMWRLWREYKDSLFGVVSGPLTSLEEAQVENLSRIGTPIGGGIYK